jgi:uncharacterized protein YqeY
LLREEAPGLYLAIERNPIGYGLPYTQQKSFTFKGCLEAPENQLWKGITMDDMNITNKIGADIITAMKAKDEHRLTTLRMVKSALKNKEIDKREPLSEAEELQILTTLIKQRRESVESFTKGDRPELAAKEQAEIGIIEAYMPQAASAEEVLAIVQGAIAHLAEGGTKPGPKDMGPAMRVVQQRILASGLRADGKAVSEMVKAELAK